MEKKKIGIIFQTALIAVFAYFALACAAQHSLGVTGGSKADGMIYVRSVTNGGFVNNEITDPTILQQVLEQAQSGCQNWGYTGAVILSQSTIENSVSTGHIVVFKCQCTGGK